MTVNARTITDEEFFYGHKACPGCGGALAVRQVLKVLGGAALLLAVKQGLKLLFAAVGFTWIGTHAIRYFFVVLLAATVWPLTFRWFARLGRKQA